VDLEASVIGALTRTRGLGYVKVRICGVKYRPVTIEHEVRTFAVSASKEATRGEGCTHEELVGASGQIGVAVVVVADVDVGVVVAAVVRDSALAAPTMNRRMRAVAILHYERRRRVHWGPPTRAHI